MSTDQTETQKFFAHLDWPTLEKKISDALRDPHKSIPLETPCPAVYSLAREIFHVAVNSAFKSPGQDLTVKELLNADQRLCVMRILEGIISAYEDWHISPGIPMENLRSVVRRQTVARELDPGVYPESPTMRGVESAHKPTSIEDKKI